MKRIDVRKLRERLKLSQAELAAELAVNQSTVHRIEVGEMDPSGPVRKLLEQIAERAA